MKEAGFIVVSGLVGAILTRFLPEVPGLGNTITLIGTLAAIAGGAIGIIFKKMTMWPLIGIILMSLGLAVYSLVRFKGVTAGEPGPEAANSLYFWATLLFLPIGVLIEVAGLKVTK